MYLLQVLLLTTQTSTPKHSSQLNQQINQISTPTASQMSTKEEILENSPRFSNLPIDKFLSSRIVATVILINWLVLLRVTILSTTILIIFKPIESMIFACDSIVTAFAILCLFRAVDAIAVSKQQQLDNGFSFLSVVESHSALLQKQVILGKM